MPCFTMIPPRGDHPMHGHFWIPIDDENCWAWSFDLPSRPRADRRASVEAMRDGEGIHVQVRARHVSSARQQGQRLPDRPRRPEGRRAPISGVAGFAMQDASLQESMGPICRPHQGEPRLDRQRHHHGAPSADARGQGAGRQGHDAARRRSRAPEGALGLRGAAARTRPSRMLPRKRSPRAPAWRRRQCNRSLTSDKC